MSAAATIRRAGPLLTLLALVGSAYPMNQHPARAVSTPLPTTVSGRVLDYAPSPFANVRLETSTGATTLTDAAGSFTLSLPTLETVILTPTLPGYTFVPLTRTVVVDPNLLPLEFLILRPPVEVIVAPDQAATLVYTDTQGITTTLAFPLATVSTTTTFRYTASPTPGLVNRSNQADQVWYDQVLGLGFELATITNGTPGHADNVVHQNVLVTRSVGEPPGGEPPRLLQQYGTAWIAAEFTCLRRPRASPHADQITMVICRLSTFGVYTEARRVALPALTRPAQ